MIASQRRSHRRIHAILWPCLFALVGLALASRRAPPVQSEWPSFLSADPRRAGSPSLRQPKAAAILWSSDELFGAWAARVTARSDGRIDVLPLRPIDRPELLLYWTSEVVRSERLPLHARLLGRVAGTEVQSFALPDEAIGGLASSGGLVLYSLGHQEIVATAALPALRVSDPEGVP